MAFYDYDTDQDHRQQEQQRTGSAAAQSDPDIQNALRGIYTGKYAELARSLPAAWPQAIKNAQVAQSIAYDKGINTGGLDSSNNFTPTNNGTPFAIQIAPYVMGGITGAGALGAFGGGAGAASGASAAGGGAAGGGSTIAGIASGAGGAGGASGWGTAAKVANLALGGSGGGGMWSWVGPAINIGSQLYGAKLQSDAAQGQTDAMAAASKYSADLQAKATAEALAFAKQQAQTDWQNQELSRSGNYGQWRAREGRISDFGGSVGLPGRQIPDYVAGIDPNYLGSSQPATIAGVAQQQQPQGQAPSGVNLDPAAMTSAVQESFQRQFGRAATPDEIQQVLGYASKPDLYSDNQWRVGVNDYLVNRVGNQSASADVKLAGTAGIIAAPAGYQGSSSTTQRRYQPMASTIAGAAQPSYYVKPTLTPALQMPGTIAGMV